MLIPYTEHSKIPPAQFKGTELTIDSLVLFTPFWDFSLRYLK